MWPVIKENVKPLTEESLETFHFLLLTRLRFPEVVKKKFLINNIGTRDVINEDSLQTCAKLLMVSVSLSFYCQFELHNTSLITLWEEIFS